MDIDPGCGNVIIVDNLSMVACEKYEELESVTDKVFTPIPEQLKEFT